MSDKPLGIPLRLVALLGSLLSSSSQAAAPAIDPVTHPAPANVTVNASDWLSVQSPFSADENNNGYTVFESGPSNAGPWTRHCGNGVPGSTDWRICTISGLVSGRAIFVRVTAMDPDGVSPAAPQVLGPFVATGPLNNATQVGATTVTVQDTHILVRQEIAGDANLTSQMVVESSTAANGPWIQKCGPYTSAAPKLCRIHGLQSGQTYYLRVGVRDTDGTDQITPKIVGPIAYTGASNLALGKPVAAAPGWGCCTQTSQIVDGIIQRLYWNFGFANRGGARCWAGGCPTGWKALTVDLGQQRNIGRVDWFVHNADSVPLSRRISVSTDGETFESVFSSDQASCRTTVEALTVDWAFPSCRQSAVFPATTARYVRYEIDDRTLFNGMHGWHTQLEIFAPGPVVPENRPPNASAGLPIAASVGQTAQLSGLGSTDPEGGALSFSWVFTTRPVGSTAVLAGASTATPRFVVDQAGDYAVTVTVTDPLGASARAQTTVTARAVPADRPPIANAGPDLRIPFPGKTVLDFEGSRDPDGDSLRIGVRVIEGPKGSVAVPIVTPGSLRATFTPDRTGVYQIRLTVFANSLSASDDVLVRAWRIVPPPPVRPPPPPPWKPRPPTVGGDGDTPVSCVRTAGYTWRYTCNGHQVTQTVNSFAGLHDFTLHNSDRVATWTFIDDNVLGTGVAHYAGCTRSVSGIVRLTEKTHPGFDYLKNFGVKGTTASWEYCTAGAFSRCTPRTRQLPTCG